MSIEKIGFGGGCHWCTEAVFDSLKGVQKVEQGWIASTPPHDTLSEAVLVHFDPEIISLKTLIEIHLLTHRSTSNHSMRDKYRSAIYTTDSEQPVEEVMKELSESFEKPLITKVLPFVHFQSSPDNYLHYYQKNREKPFCKTYINPKLSLLMKQFSKHVQLTTTDKVHDFQS
ncbi:MAG: peptide-methionine (S)-S-oxide reductase [Cyclobacteriaceae bacterium]